MGMGRIEINLGGGSDWGDKDVEALRKLHAALVAFSRSVEHSLSSGQYAGTGDMISSNYERMRKKSRNAAAGR